MINGPFYTYRRIHFTSENASFCELSVIIRETRTSQRPPGRVGSYLYLLTTALTVFAVGSTGMHLVPLSNYFR